MFKIGDKVRYVDPRIDDNEAIVLRVNEDGSVKVDTRGKYGVCTEKPESLRLVNNIQIEAGKYYKTRDGRKVGPMCIKSLGSYRWGCNSIGQLGGSFRDNGVGIYFRDDLVSEWHDGPVREVTRREIVTGTYGKVRVTEGRYVHCKSMKTAEELREAAYILNQIAEAM